MTTKLDCSDYQLLASRTAFDKGGKFISLAVSALGLAGEAGECVDIIKKHLGHNRPLDREKLILELGDVFWYMNALCAHIGVSFEEVFAANIIKIEKRYPNGVPFSHGSGE